MARTKVNQHSKSENIIQFQVIIVRQHQQLLGGFSWIEKERKMVSDTVGHADMKKGERGV